jgi:Tol biopolymer transport system component
LAVTIGSQLGSHEILHLLGKGGMGEVYRARDRNLKREVAIKILPEEFSRDAERLSRFQREAEVLASLNHPNIAAIHSLEEAEGSRFLVLELVEGETLAERIARGPIPLDEALSIATSIGEALQAAHEKGIVHRDLKPANIKITPDGKVKVLDFGLAKAAENAPVNSALTNSPTLSLAATNAGMILGTAAYMSPEQARGKPIDQRTDIWAFGVVLYEMLTGQTLFEGEDAGQTLAAVIMREPDLSKTPAKVRRLLRACLQKNPRERLQAIGDWRLLLEETPQVQRLPQPPARRSYLAWGIAGLFLLTTAGLSFLYLRARPAPRPLVHLDVDLGPDVSLGSQAGPDTILSPDGTRLVYVSQNRLFTRRLDQPKASELAGTDGAFAPFFSPDGHWVAFFTLAGSKLKKVSVEGGAAVSLCDAPTGRGGSWGEDGNIIAAIGNIGNLTRIPSSGGMPETLTEATPGAATTRWPQVLPGGKAVLVVSHNSTNAFDGANIEVLSLADRSRKTLVKGALFGHYLPSGHLVYVSRGTLFAVPFDLDRLEVRGTPVPVVEDVAYSTFDGSAQFDFSQNGMFVYRSGAGALEHLVTVQWLDAAGRVQPLLTKPGVYGRPSVAPDGNRLAMQLGGDAWVYEPQRETMTRVTFNGGVSSGPIWSPDGRFLVFAAPGGLYWTRSDGASKPQPLSESKNVQIAYSFAPNGKRFAFMEFSPATGYDLSTIPLENDTAGLRPGKPEFFLQTPANERQDSFSPDGRWLAYSSDESGTYQVYVRAFPDKGGKWQISNGGGVFPIFARNNRDLFYRTEDNQVMAVAYTVKDDVFVAEKPRVFSEKRLANIGANSNYDVAPDGKRIAALMPAEVPQGQQAETHVIFLENFFDELRRRVPAR